MLLEQDYKGINGPNWQKEAHEFLELVDTLVKKNIIYIDNKGIALWSTSNKVIPLGYINALILLGVSFDKKETIRLRQNVLSSTKKQYDSRFIDALRETNLNDKNKTFWIRDYFKKVISIQKDYIVGKCYIDSHGIARWKSNNRIIPRECLEYLAYSGICPRIYFEKNDKERKEETSKSLEQYKKSMENYKPSIEEIAEMESVFGKGTPIVDIITGKRLL